MSAPFGSGSVSLRLYPHLDLDAPAIVEELRAQAALAATQGFDGVMTSEHHGGFAGYLPNPLQSASFALDAMPSGWAAPCPLLLPLRPSALVIEETAWLAARHPGRVGLGVAAGALPADFEIMDTTMDDLTTRFAAGLTAVARVLGGGDAGDLASDPAVARLHDHPVPVVERGRQHDRGAARRRVRCGPARRLAHDADAVPRARRRVPRGGRRGAVRVDPAARGWETHPPRRPPVSSTPIGRTPGPRPRIGAPTSSPRRPTRPRSRAGCSTPRHSAGADALNIRVHVPGVPPQAVRDQIERMGNEVLPVIGRALT